MGKIIFTPIQKAIFDRIFDNKDISQNFYFTGGTALSVFYYQHRYSEDLDFFTENDFGDETIIKFVNSVSEELELKVRFTRRDKARIFELTKKDRFAIKLDFVHYLFKRIKKGKEYNQFDIDSLLDIGANKLLTINQRTDVKDFVDLYFLLKDFTVWDLIYACEAKFKLETDIILLGADFMKIDGFETLPKMIKPLTLDELKKFFRDQAKTLGKRVTY